MTGNHQPPRVGDIEYELGYPIPGHILPPEQWASTAVHRLPESEALDFQKLFGRQSPVVLDIGCGNGRFVVTSAVRRPEVDHLGIDILPVVIRYATRRGRQRGLHNTRFAVSGGAEFLRRYIPRGSLAEIHIYHPQPYQNPAVKHLRLLTPDFFELVHNALRPSGQLYLQSDNAAYWQYLQQSVSQLMNWQEVTTAWPDDPHGRSRREIIASSQGLPIFRSCSTRREDLSDEQISAIVRDLPPPDFAASPQRNRTGWTRASKSRPARRKRS